MAIHHLLLQAASANLSSTASANPSSSTGSDAPENSSLNPVYLLYIAAAVTGVAALIIVSRFTCRRVDACRTTAEQRQAREVAAGASAGGQVRELPAPHAEPSEPLISNRPRSCLNRFFCARTTGRGILSDLGTSASEGVVAALGMCGGGGA